MKTLCFFLAALLSASAAAAQNSWADGDHPSLFVLGGFNEMFVQDPGHIFNISFPYTTTAVSGTQTFSGSLKGSYRPEVPMFDVLLLDVVYKRSGYYLGYGLNRQLGNDYAGYVKFGYDYAFPFHGLMLKPGLDLVFFTKREERMGSIDNVNQTVSALGIQSGDYYTVTIDDGEYATYDETYSTDHLDIDYSRSSLDLGPRLTLSTRPFWGKAVLSLQAGWLLPLVQTSRLRFEQVSAHASDPTHLAGHVTLPQNGSVGGPYVGITAGVRVGRVTRS
ncbi:hypothetical protein [Dinghuibacter silviterrae]|uniref:Outer membrane protein with beta-barrel domain n=1 Tax=Dinghuibacter silviterrae TaxID=1539049 RepID=A0A4R8DIP5_9BACT|nr:hypothetical protein [Dinghuibacter silviterrae]TDW97378.1 hypothetical protein EDB95_5226 [Dinghuibacter silviterrae]